MAGKEIPLWNTNLNWLSFRKPNTEHSFVPAHFWSMKGHTQVKSLSRFCLKVAKKKKKSLRAWTDEQEGERKLTENISVFWIKSWLAWSWKAGLTPLFDSAVCYCILPPVQLSPECINDWTFYTTKVQGYSAWWVAPCSAGSLFSFSETTTTTERY